MKKNSEPVKCGDETMSTGRNIHNEELQEERVRSNFLPESASEFDNLSTEPKIAESQSKSKLPVLSKDETASKLNINSNPNVSNTDDTIEIACEAVSLNTSELSELGKEETASKLNVTLDSKVNEEMDYDRPESMTFFEKHKEAFNELPRVLPAHFKTLSESPKESKSEKLAASPNTGDKKKFKPPNLLLKKVGSSEDETSSNSPFRPFTRRLEKMDINSTLSPNHQIADHYGFIKRRKTMSPTVSSDSSTLTDGTLTPGSDNPDSVSGTSAFFRSHTKAESYESEVTVTSKLPKESAGSLLPIERSKSGLCDQSVRPKSSDQSERPKSSDQSERPKSSDQSARPKSSDQSERPKSSDQSERPKSSDQSERPKS